MKKSIGQLKEDIENNKYSKTELKNLIFRVTQVLNKPNDNNAMYGDHEEK
jgi:hypothetical protein